MADEILIGFDARETGECDPRWSDDDRRERFLLRRDVARPLSVDRHAWATIFAPWHSKRNREWARSLPAEERERFRSVLGELSEEERYLQGLGSIRVPDWAVAANAPLWEDLARMKSYLDEQGVDPADRVPVAVGWLSRLGFRDPGNEDGYKKTPFHVPAEPAQPEASWNLLGYDVADAALFSGLSDCGYTREDSERLRGSWVSALNDHHLFSAHGPAFEFVDVTNARVPEHAPFHVYSLYRLP